MAKGITLETGWKMFTMCFNILMTPVSVFNIETNLLMICLFELVMSLLLYMWIYIFTQF